MNSTKYHSPFLLCKLHIHTHNVRVCAHCNVPITCVVKVNVQHCLLSGPPILASHRHTFEMDMTWSLKSQSSKCHPGVRFTQMRGSHGRGSAWGRRSQGAQPQVVLLGSEGNAKQSLFPRLPDSRNGLSLQK